MGWQVPPSKSSSLFRSMNHIASRAYRPLYDPNGIAGSLDNSDTIDTYTQTKTKTWQRFATRARSMIKKRYNSAASVTILGLDGKDELDDMDKLDTARHRQLGGAI